MNTLTRLDTTVSQLFHLAGPLLASSSKTSPPTSPSTRASYSPTRLSNLPPTPRPRRKRRNPPTSSSIKVPPPSTPLLLRIALALWAILLAFWRSLVGETRAERVVRSRRRANTYLRGLRRVASLPSDDSAPEDSQGSEGEGDADWVDPVTRASVEPLDVPEDDEFAATADEARAVEPISFRLRSADSDVPSRNGTPEHSKQPFTRSPTPPSILANPVPGPRTRSASRRLLPNPMSTSLLDPSVPASSTMAFSAGSSGLSVQSYRHQTPFHLQKTLILDLDETLIHSTSRPMGYGANGGGGLSGLSFGGLLGGRKSRAAGHTVEVVLGGRSTTYHVYKRPYVDHFLKKVRPGDQPAPTL